MSEQFLALLLGLLILVSSLGLDSFAEVETVQKPGIQIKTKTPSGSKKKTSIDFEDELIQGEVKKPELFYLLQKKQFNFKKLIKLREDFIPEMRRTAEDVKGGGQR